MSRETSRAWIDASSPYSLTRIWGMTLTERIVRQLAETGVSTIAVKSQDADATRRSFRPDFWTRYTKTDVHFIQETAEKISSLQTMLLSARSGVLVLEGNGLYDERLTTRFSALERASFALEGDSAHPILCLCFRDNLRDEAFGPNVTLGAFVRMAAESADRVEVTKLPSYYRRLRAYQPIYWLLVEKREHAVLADAYLKGSVHKSTNDLIAKFIHPPFEFALTRLLCRTGIQPNQITFFNVLLAFSAIPFFYTGHFAIALSMALLKGVTDGVDGKLARITLRTTNFGDKLDHISDTIYLNGYYIAMALYFSKAEASSFPLVALAWIIPTYFLDRVVRYLFTRRHHETIQDYRKMDTRFRLIQSNRNISMWTFLIFFLTGHPLWGYYAIAFWTPSNFIYYGIRHIWEYNRVKTHDGYEEPDTPILWPHRQRATVS